VGVGTLAMVPPGTVSSALTPTAKEVMSEASLEKYARLLAVTFFQLKCIVNLGTWTQCPR